MFFANLQALLTLVVLLSMMVGLAVLVVEIIRWLRRH